ncbi:MAG: glutamate formimidoyltransferase [Pseudomonadota bacterium]
MILVECVPNFSEGRDPTVIEAIAAEIRSVAGVELLDVDPGAATNRTVYTFAGAPETVLEAAFQAIRKGSELIDMRHQKGEHARQGACDVCPFVPIAGATMADCIELAKRLGERVGRELKIPVYLYAEAATKPGRRNLPDIRAGEYEALPEKLKKPEWRPDFGPAEFNARAGATVIGARNFLIAYNVNLNTRNAARAKEIAFSIRESGRIRRDRDGNKIIGPDGAPEREPGAFKGVQATGWLIPEYNRAQVTINILDIAASPLHLIFDKCSELASAMGLRATGSEIVGMVPRGVLIDAGLHFLRKQGSTTGVSEGEIIRTAIISLGLNDVGQFDPAKKIIEERFAMSTPLASMTVKDFANELASSSPAPGGGSAAALSGALSAALTSMVAALTFDKKGFEKHRAEMEEIGVRAQELLRAQVKSIDDDTAAFNRVMDALSLPKGTDEQKAARKAAIEEANKGATLEPLGTLERSISMLDIALSVAEKGNPNSLSDAGVAGLTARAAAHGAYYNVLINLAGISDKKWSGEIHGKAEKLIAAADQKSGSLEQLMHNRLEKSKGVKSGHRTVGAQ